MATSRQQLVQQPRSGARPLTGTAAPKPAAAKKKPRTPAATRKPRPPAGTAARAPRRQAKTAPPPPTTPQPSVYTTMPNINRTQPLPAPAPASPAAAPAAAASPAPAPRRDFGGSDSAGLVLALFAYPLAVNLLQGGPSRMWAWVKAKWLNQPYAAAATSGPGRSAGGNSTGVQAPQQQVPLPGGGTVTGSSTLGITGTTRRP